MYKYITILILAVGLLFSGCGRQSLRPERTVIAGVVEGFSDATNVLTVNYCDPFSDDRYAQNLAETDGQFSAAHEYLFAQNLTIRFAGRFINLFVHPGDSVFVHIDARRIADGVADAVTFLGDNAKLNRELLGWSLHSKDIFAANPPSFDLSIPIEQMQAALEDNFGRMADSIEAYARRTGMGNEAQKWALVDHKFSVANQIMDYDDPEADEWEFFTGPVFDVFDEGNFRTMMFPYHLEESVLALMGSEPEFRRLASEGEIASAARLMVEKLREKAPEGVVRDVILFKLLESPLTQMPELWDSLPELRSAFSQELIYRKLETIAHRDGLPQQATISAEETDLDGIVLLDGRRIEPLGNVQFMNYLTERHSGKVIYIDVWATWCGPCIAEFGSTPPLHDYFEESEEVVFVNLCLASEYEAWQPGIAKYGVDGENYFFEGDATAQFMAEYSLPGYPSYLLIGRDGTVDNRAPRPSNLEAAIGAIEALLKHE